MAHNKYEHKINMPFKNDPRSSKFFITANGQIFEMISSNVSLGSSSGLATSMISEL